LNQIKAFLAEHWELVLVAILLLTPAVSWAGAIVQAIFGLVNWLGVAVAIGFFGSRWFTRNNR